MHEGGKRVTDKWFPEKYVINEIDRRYILCHPEDIRNIYAIMERSLPLEEELQKSDTILNTVILKLKHDIKNHEKFEKRHMKKCSEMETGETI